MTASQQLARAISIALAIVFFKSSLTAGCANVLSAESGWFTSPDHPEDYPNNANECWLINVTYPVLISFTSFHTESGYDWLKIYDGPNTSFPLHFQASTSQPISFPVALSNNQILVTFISDSSGSYSGFNATYLSNKCQHVISSEMGWISSPNHPLQYPDNVICRWLFKTEGKISFSFHRFDLENNDWLTIYDGPSEVSSVLLETSSNETDLSLIETNSHWSLVVFTSDGSGSSSGFNATYSVSRCNYVLSADSGWFTSPNHPQDYPDYVDCRWLINSKQPIVLNFIHFKTEKNVDVLTVYNGPTTESNVLIKASSEDSISPIVSTANQTLITFIINPYKFGSHSGFNITYEPFRCQYELSSVTGLISSPNYPLKYPPNVDCTWLINANHPIIISFTKIALDKCCDVLTIYDGPTKSSPVLVNSTTIVPSALASTTNQMLIAFTTSSSGSESIAGFTATYSAYGCQKFLSSESGWFSLKDGETNCRWFINAKQRVMISFNTIHMENNEELTIYDGITESAYILFQTSPDETVVPDLIEATGQQALILFTSDKSLPYSRFNATYMPYKCEQVLTSDSGSFTSPKYPDEYPNNANCSWLIVSKQPIMLTFDSFHMQEDRDWVTIYNGPTESSTVLAKSSKKIHSIVSTSNQVLVTFTSDESWRYNGFKATYKSCQYISALDSEWFTSPNYPLSYPDNVDMCWLINTTYPISLSFSHFDLETNKDWIKVYDGPTTKFELLKASSNDSLPLSIISTKNQMLVTFTSDASNSFSGFNATFLPYKCQYVLSSESGWFTSPHYPQNYPGNSNCSWLINATNRISLSFPSFSVEKGSDWVKVYDGPTTSSVELLRASSYDSIPRSIVSSSNQLLITFTSDRTQSDSGFNATYSQCQVHSKNSGWLSSPNYPENYPDGASLCWLIKATVQLEFAYGPSHTENQADFLTVYNGPTQSSQRILQITGKTLPWSERMATAREILVTFTSDALESFSGFNLTYQLGCHTLRTWDDWNSFSSINYPEQTWVKVGEKGCWVINSDHPILFNITHCELEINHDWLRIYDGPTENFPLLLEATSNYTIPSSIVSTARKVLVTFFTNSTLSYSGFKSNYFHYYPGVTERPVECNENIHVNSSEYILTSLKFPNKYPNIRCNWRFTSDPGSRLHISFTDFSTHPIDYVSIFDREVTHNTDIPLMLTSGFNASSPLLCNYMSEGNYMHVSFNPIFDYSIKKSIPSTAGFRAIVTAAVSAGCGGNYSSSAGVLLGSKTNVQDLMPTECVWYIQVGAGSKVSLTLNTLHGPNSSSDSFSLTVYEGHVLKTNDTLLANVTGLSSLSKSLYVISKSNEMAIILNDAMEYNKYKCRPRERDYTKLYLTYKAIPSSTYGG